MIFNSRWLFIATLIVFTVVTIGLFTGCPGDAPSNGTLTVRVTGADAHNGAYFYYAVVIAGDDLSDPADWVGVAPTDPTIAGGTVECVTVEVGTDNPATYTGGESYDVGGLIDIDLDSDPTSGLDYVSGPTTVRVDGDTILELIYPTDFELVP